jgi:hypothetical protein
MMLSHIGAPGDRVKRVAMRVSNSENHHLTNRKVMIITFHIGNRRIIMQPSSTEAAEALATMRASQARLAQAADCPPERHLAFAVVMGGLVATPVLPSFYAIIAEGVLLLGVALIVRWDRRRTGMFINGYRAGRTRPLTFLLLAAVLVLYMAGFWLVRDRGIWWGPLATGTVAAGVGYYASVVWKRVFRREMGLDA